MILSVGDGGCSVVLGGVLVVAVLLRVFRNGVEEGILQQWDLWIMMKHCIVILVHFLVVSRKKTTMFLGEKSRAKIILSLCECEVYP